MSRTDATVMNLQIRLSRQEVLRYLGYPRSKAPQAQVEQMLDQLWSEAQQLLHPRGSCRIVDQQLAATTKMPDPSPVVGLGLCTIGPQLEQREHTLSQRGQMLEALLLDAVGSAAAEATADALTGTLCTQAQAKGYGLHPRISPGHGRWDIRGQKELLLLLEAKAVGVQLTEGMMMVPRKSLSFAVRFDEKMAAGRIPSRCCAQCDMQDCAYRRS